MVFLYQTVIFSIIVLSSFVGFIGLILSVLGAVIFTLMNVFSFELMAVQLSTIFIASIIGIIISTLRLFITLPTLKKILIVLGKFISKFISTIKYLIKLPIVTLSRKGLIYSICGIFRFLKYIIFNSKRILVNTFEFIVLKLWDFKESNIIMSFFRLVIIIAIRVLMGGILGALLNIEVESTFFIVVMNVLIFLYLCYCVTVTTLLPMQAVGISNKMGLFIIIISIVAFIFGLEIVESILETIL